MKIPSPTPTFSRAVCAVLLLVAITGADAMAQLRPLEPTDFRALEGERMRVQIGAGVYFEQHASLTGTRGRLLELGELRTSWRSGRIIVEVSGTLQRFFKEDTVIGTPAEGVDASSADGVRHDAGDYRVQTVLRLTSDTALTAAVLRFGTRLPTSDNRVGLERDQTDFFASLGMARAVGPLHIGAEAGISINGTRLPHYEQSDLFIYAASVEAGRGIITPFVSVVGQNDMHRWTVRGNEDLGEIRAGVRIGSKRWVNAVFVRGFHESSPRAGFVLNAGVSFGR
jgi:hypothetical protein